MIPKSIVRKLNTMGEHTRRPPEKIPEVIECLEELGVSEHKLLRDFVVRYRLSAVRGTQLEELLDVASPTRQIAKTTFWARDVFEMGDDFICLTTGEGEGFILYSKRDRKVYDVGIEELEALEQGTVAPRWESFYDMLEWYLQ